MIGYVLMLAMFVFLLFASGRYREDIAKLFRLETTTLSVAVRNPIATVALFLAFVLPILITEGF